MNDPVREQIIKLLQGGQAHSSAIGKDREAMRIADHNAYHIGQRLLVRRLLETWQESS